ncbi:MAG: histidine kinase dimerization/phospho-acceptor domain-containing protein [Thiogranum sp.]
MLQIFIGVITIITLLLGTATEERNSCQQALRQANSRLEERTRELEQSNRELESFSYSVSHDLRAPLRAIDGFAAALCNDFAGNIGEQGNDHLRRIRSAAQRMGKLIDDMLQLARVTRVALHRQSVDLSAVAGTTGAQAKSVKAPVSTLPSAMMATAGKREPRRDHPQVGRQRLPG